jgi:hypothetical protein
MVELSGSAVSENGPTRAEEVLTSSFDDGGPADWHHSDGLAEVSDHSPHCIGTRPEEPAHRTASLRESWSESTLWSHLLVSGIHKAKAAESL